MPFTLKSERSFTKTLVGGVEKKQALSANLINLREMLKIIRLGLKEIVYYKKVLAGEGASFHTLIKQIADEDLRGTFLYCYFSGPLELTVQSRGEMALFTLLFTLSGVELDSKSRLLLAHIPALMSFGDEIADGQAGKEQNEDSKLQTQQRLSRLKAVYDSEGFESVKDAILNASISLKTTYTSLVKLINQEVVESERNWKIKALDSYIQTSVLAIFRGIEMSKHPGLSIDEVESYYIETDRAALEFALALVGSDITIDAKEMWNLVLVSQMFDDWKDLAQDEGVKVNFVKVYLEHFDRESISSVLSGRVRFEDTKSWMFFDERIKTLLNNKLFKFFSTQMRFAGQNIITDTDSSPMRIFHTLVFPWFS